MRRAKFTPTGPYQFRGRGARALAANPELWSGPPAPTAHLFVGMNIKGDPVWALPDVIETVRAVRTAQTGDPSSTFIAQRGVYKHEGNGGVVEEDSAQIIIYDLSDEVDEREFESQMVELATGLARTLQQELVIVEMHEGGKASKTLGVGP